MTRRTMTRLIGGAAAAALTLFGTALPTQAGEVQANGPSTFRTHAYGADAQTVLEGLTLEVFMGTVAPGATGTDITSSVGCTPIDEFGPPMAVLASSAEQCGLPGGDTYTVGVLGVPAGYRAVGTCYTYGSNREAIDGFDTTFTLGEFEVADCDIYVGPEDASMVYSIITDGLGHEAAMAGLDVEVYQDGSLVDPLDCTKSAPTAYPPMYGPASVIVVGTCDLEPTFGGDLPVTSVPISNYELGLSALPEGYGVDYAECFPFYLTPVERFTDPTVGFGVYLDELGLPSTLCEIYLSGPPTVYVEHIVQGGSAETTDFTTQLFGDTGALAGASSDPSDQFCQGGLQDFANVQRLIEVPSIEPIIDACGTIVAPAATYSVGALIPDYGYEAEIDCSGEPPFGWFEGGRNERIVADLAELGHPYPDANASLCVLTATYYEQTISVDVVTDNAAGGDSDGSDIEVEVYDQDGTLVDSGFDPAPNDPAQSAEFTLPIGDYTIGVTGPGGYTFTVDVTVTENDITDVTLPLEIIDDGSADIALSSTETATVEVLAAGQAAPTTTTTTLAPTTTTIAPTTTALAATTTALGAGAILPATGGSSTTDNLAWWALGLLAAGLLVFRASRRPAPHAR